MATVTTRGVGEPYDSYLCPRKPSTANMGGNMVLRSIPGLLSLDFMATLMSCCFIRVILRPFAEERLKRIQTNSVEREEEAAYTHNLSNQHLASICVVIINGVVQDVWCVNVRHGYQRKKALLPCYVRRFSRVSAFLQRRVG